MTTLKKGDKAPLFTLKTMTAEGLKDVSLADNIGKKATVLLFIPFAFTGVCTDELCSVSQNLDAYKDLDAAVYGISVDSPFAQQGWAAAKHISLTLLSDFNKEVVTAYGVKYEDFIGFKGVSKRSAFVVGKDGKIAYAWVSEDPKVLPDFAAIQAALKA